MIVPLRVDGAANEWCIVELQGELIPNDGADLKDVSIGSLWYENGVPTVRIGNHILTGKIAKLPKPFAILEKPPHVEEASEKEASDEGAGSSRAEFQVVGIARTRIIFSTRPKPVLT